MQYNKVRLNIESTCEYSIDTNGVIVNETTNRVIAGSSITKSNRYVTVSFDKKVKLHKLVAEYFVPNPDPIRLTQVNHIDGDRMNNKADNLEWVTPRQNVQHAYDTGLKTNQGELNPISILTEDIVVDIWRLSKAGHKPTNIIKLLKLNVCRCAVSKVTNKKNWTHVTDKL